MPLEGAGQVLSLTLPSPQQCQPQQFVRREELGQLLQHAQQVDV
jgi:hypothetical protein